jgi:HK97 family phage major capsid protein
MGRCMRIPITKPGKNSLRVNIFDEASRANGSRFGGLRMRWLQEGEQLTGTKPKFNGELMQLKKLGGLCYATEELFEDAQTLEATLSQAFAEECSFTVEQSAMTGTGAGAGEMLGVLNSPALITVAKESGQSAGTFVSVNIEKMYQRMYAAGRHRAVWFVNAEAETALIPLTIESGSRPVYIPATNPGEYAMMLGCPVVPVEYLPVIGTKGDLLLCDPSQYLIVDKNSMQTTPSIHVRFNYDEMAFKFIYRVDGQPSWPKPIAPLNGTLDVSSFVTLAARG